MKRYNMHDLLWYWLAVPVGIDYTPFLVMLTNETYGEIDTSDMFLDGARIDQCLPRCTTRERIIGDTVHLLVAVEPQYAPLMHSLPLPEGWLDKSYPAMVEVVDAETGEVSYKPNRAGKVVTYMGLDEDGSEVEMTTVIGGWK